ncbi:MAG: hypothetical protein HY557_07150 [Euryarchaeota archaeon]|nr:hypothetical protein [Euryarchaeota archaeon]
MARFGQYWKSSASETYFLTPEFELLVIPLLGILFVAFRRRCASRTSRKGAT